jgi:hypothetical protein
VVWERNIGVGAMRRSWVQLAPLTKITNQELAISEGKKNVTA